MSNDLSRLLLIAAIAVAAQGAHAAETGGINVGELSAVQSQTLFFKAQAELNQAKASAGQGSTASLPAYAPPPAVAPVASTHSDQAQRARNAAPEYLPVVKTLYGSPRDLRATLLYPNGQTAEARMGGGLLPGGYSLSGISLQGVELSRGGRRFPLGFADQAPGSMPVASQPLPGAESALPGVPAGEPTALQEP
ncbi:type IV pilus biogenesis protein PilP [Pseudomonas oryzihabitans]|uniref:type IV pilus biogenesis protein PilP n=1 Tax=Pseudomonas oryzihabitans TaxID=47885 RepID=UPI00069333C2|nr:type IV pilus biogenesis protein PilP [Pseudomonas oryzihabitans]NMZ44169.1 type IV pilus biogenesis protein PilP [Pseudomonas oryzihabitans]